MSADTQKQGRVVRTLPDKRVIISVGSEQITAVAHGLVPRPGAQVLISNTGRNWAVISWQ